MNRTVGNESSNLRVIVIGAVALILLGMGLITVVSIFVTDSSATVAALGGMVTMGAAGLFGLRELNKGVQDKIDASAQVTTEAVAGVAHQATKIGYQLNGDLDRRIRVIVEEVVPITVKQAVHEALVEWTSPPPRR
jgi:hypothetical protein